MPLRNIAYEVSYRDPCQLLNVYISYDQDFEGRKVYGMINRFMKFILKTVKACANRFIYFLG